MCRHARSAADSIASRIAGSSAGDGDSSISFWWRRWIEHSRSPQRQDAAVLVADHLDLDVPRRRDRLLDVERAVRERRLGLGRARVEYASSISSGPWTSRMPLPPPPAAAFSSTGKPSSSAATRASASVAAPSVPGTSGTPAAHLRLRARLVPHLLHHVRGRADEDEVVVLARAHERRILGEESVAGMDRLAAGRRGGGDEFACAGSSASRRRPDATAGRRAGRAARARRPSSRRRRPDAELVERADDADGDLAAVRYEDATKLRHRGGARERLELEEHLPELDRLRVVDVDLPNTAATSDFTSFMSFIASRMQSVWPAPTTSPSSTNGGDPGSGAR